MTAYSLRRRLLVWLLLATLVIGLVALLDTWREALRTAQSVSDRVLFGSALAIAERVTVDETGVLEVDIPFSSLEMLTSAAQDRVFYRVDGPVGQYLTGYGDLPVVAAGPGGVGFADGTYGAVGIRSATLWREVSTGARSVAFTVTVAESTLARAALARSILIRSALRLLVLGLGVSCVVWVAVTLALRPLDRLGLAIAARSQGDLRAVPVEVPQEVAPLVQAINSFMSRLETALEALRHFTGNASHQLRTPLSVVRTQLALIDRSATPSQSQAATAKAQAALERAEKVLAQLLVLARVDAASGAAVLAPVSLLPVAKDLTMELVPLALGREMDLGFDGTDPGEVMAEPVLVAELLKNLLTNAITYAGRGAIVTVRVRRDPGSGGMVLAVEDNGPGLSPAQMAQASSRKRTVSAPKAAPQPDPDPDVMGGYGLGLAIALEIADLFGAQLHFGTGVGGRGLLVEVCFAPMA